MKEASRQQGIKAPRAEVFFRGVRVGPLAVALLAMIQRHRGIEESRQRAGHVKCLVPWCLVALMPAEPEPAIVLWFALGGMLGAVAYGLLRMADWVQKDIRAEKMDLRGPQAAAESVARQQARVLTESEHRELLLTCLSDAMRNPVRRVDIRGVAALWSLSKAQKAVWLAWLRGQEIEWQGHLWVAGVERVESLVFVRFTPWEGGRRRAEGGSEVVARPVTERIVVARGKEARS